MRTFRLKAYYILAQWHSHEMATPWVKYDEIDLRPEGAT